MAGRILESAPGTGSFDNWQERMAKLEAENAALRQAAASKLKLKVSEKGALSVYGLGRFPVTLYRSQWDALLKEVPTIQAFIEANTDRLATKA